jgi:hypothetical protein
MDKQRKLNVRPLPRGEGGSRPALSLAGAGRVRGQFHVEIGADDERH